MSYTAILASTFFYRAGALKASIIVQNSKQLNQRFDTKGLVICIPLLNLETAGFGGLF